LHLGFINLKLGIFPNKFLAPLAGSWRFLILEFTWAFDSRLLFLKKKNFKKIKKKFEKKNFWSSLSHYEHELFWRYYQRLHAFLAHCSYLLGKWELLDTSANCETRALL